MDRAWEDLCASNPRYHDGDLLTVLGVSRNGHGGVTINLASTSYRFHAVRRAGVDLGLQPLGVKAMVARDGHWLMGKRSSSVSTYPSLWEFVPGGSVEPGTTPIDALAREWTEETGLPVEVLGPLVPEAVLFDPTALTWEIAHRARVAPHAASAMLAMHPSWEHESLAWCTIEDIERLGDTLSPAAAMMMELARAQPAGV